MRHKLALALARGGVGEVETLVAAGAPLAAGYDLDDLGKVKGSVVDLALLHQRFCLALRLLQGESGNALARASLHALSWSALHGRSELLTELLQRRADIERPDEQGRSALNVATLRGHKCCVELLVNAGAWDKEQARADVQKWGEHWKLSHLLEGQGGEKGG